MSKNNGQGTLTINIRQYDATGNVTIHPRTLPFHVHSTRQTDKFTETLGIELDEYWNKMSELSNGKVLTNGKIAIVFLWSALYAGAIRVNRKCDFTHEDVIDWFEDAETDEETAELMKPILLFAEMLAETKKKLEAGPTA